MIAAISGPGAESEALRADLGASSRRPRAIGCPPRAKAGRRR